MRILYVLGEELNLTRKKIDQGIVRFESNAHYTANMKPVKGIWHKLPNTFNVKERIGNIDPVGYLTNRMSKIEPVYILDWRNLFPATSCKGNALQFESEKNFKMTPELLSTMLELKLDKNLLTEEPFAISKKAIIIIAIVGVVSFVLMWWFAGHPGLKM